VVSGQNSKEKELFDYFIKQGKQTKTISFRGRAFTLPHRCKEYPVIAKVDYACIKEPIQAAAAEVNNSRIFYARIS
jgi:hypothetical protein